MRKAQFINLFTFCLKKHLFGFADIYSVLVHVRIIEINLSLNCQINESSKLCISLLYRVTMVCDHYFSIKKKYF